MTLKKSPLTLPTSFIKSFSTGGSLCLYLCTPSLRFESIPSSLWWALITLTTVGYGDMYPKTLFGQIIGSACAVTGALLLGLTIPTLIKNFLRYVLGLTFPTLIKTPSGTY